MPARFRILTTACKPLESSKARRAGDESTKMHSSVSKTTEDSGNAEPACVRPVPEPFADMVLVVVVNGTDDRCREAKSKSTKTYA